MKKLVSHLLLLVVLTLSTASIAQTPFTGGNLVVVRVGGGAALSTAATQVAVAEYNTSGTLIATRTFQSSTTIPSAGVAPFLNVSGSTVNEGFGSTSIDGAFFALLGYNTTNGTASVNSIAGNRSIGLANANGSLTYPVTNTTYGGTNTIRSVASDGTGYWATTSNTAAGSGLAYINSSGTVTTLNGLNGRCVGIFNGQLFATSQTTLQAFGTGLPTTSGQTGTVLVNMSNANAFSFSPNHDILYVADESGFNANATSCGGIRKFTRAPGSSTWDFQYTLNSNGTSATTPCRGLVVDWSGASPVIYATVAAASNNAIIRVIDNGSALSSSNTSGVAPTIFVAGTTNIRLAGISFAPKTPSIVLSGTPTVAPHSLVANPYLVGSGPIAVSTASFIVNGRNLIGNITVTAPSNFQVSTNPSTGFSSSISLTPTSGSITDQTVYIRLVGGLPAGSYSGYLSVTTAGCPQPGGVYLTGSIGPSIITSTASLSPYYSQSGQNSYEQSFTISSNGFLIGNVTVTAPANFQVSSDNVTYSNSITLPQSGGSLIGEPVTVFVRVSSTATPPSVGGPAVNVTCSSPSATTQYVNIPTSTVIPAASAFTPGNIVISRIGNGSAPLTNAATMVFLDEYTPGGTFVQTLLLNTASGTNKRITNSGSATSEGHITLSLDGSKLVVVGYDAIPGTSAVVSTPASTTNRIVGVVNANGSLNSTTRIPDGYDINNIRSGVTIDGTYFWTTGASGASNDGGVRYSALGSSSSTQLSTAPTNARVINIFDNQIWISASSAPNIGISKVGSGVSNATGQPIFLETSTPTNPYSFLLFDRDPLVNGPDLLYVADQTGGLMKFSYNGSTWTPRGALTGAASGITGRLNGSTVEIYATVGTAAGNTVRFITDATSYTTSISGALATTGTLVATAPANTVFRSVQFAPVALPGTPAVALTRIEPAAGPILQASSQNILYGVQVTASVANAILTKITLTTAGTYTTSDFVPNSFRLWYSSDNSFEPTDILIGTAPTPSSGGTLEFNIAQKIFNTTSGYFFLTADVEGSATIGNTIHITATPLANFVFANNATKSGTVTAGGVKTIVSSVLPTTFYSNGGDLNDLSNWGDQPDGSVFVSGPANFTTNNYTFIVANGSNTINGNWTVSGTNTKIVVPASSTLNLPAAYTFSGTVHVLNNGTLNIYGTSVPTFGLLEENSNVNFASVSPISQTIPGSLTVSYGNLKLTGSGTKVIGGVFNTSPILVKGQFVIDNTTLDRTLTTYQVIAFEKDYTINNGVNYLTGFSTYVNLEPRGSANQVIRGNGSPVKAGRFYINIDNAGNTTNLKPSGIVELSPLTGGTNLVLSDDFKTYCGTGNSAQFADNGNTIFVGGDLELDGNDANYNFSGTISFTGTSGTQNIRRSGIGAGATAIPVASLNNLLLDASGTTVIQVQPTTGSSDLIVKGNFTIQGTGTGKFTPDGNTIKIAGNFNDTRTIDMIAPGTSTFEFNGTSPQTLATAYTNGESMFNIIINNPSNVTITNGNFRCTSTGNLNCLNGKLFTGSNKIILNNTASITETETSNVQGIVEITKVLTTANETFGGIGLEIQSTPAPGSTLVRRITGATVALGCANTSVKRLFEVTPATNTGLNATVKYIYLDSELGDLSEPELQLYRFLGAGPWTEITNGTLNPTTNVITVTGQTSLGKYSATNPLPVGGQITPATSVICSGTTKTLTLNNFAGLLQWQVSLDNSTWSNISGATNSTYTTPALTAKRYYRCIAYSSLCFEISSTTAVVDVSSTPIVTFTNVTSTSATVTWTPFGTGQYNISWSGAGTGSVTGVTTNTFVITGLSANADLTVSVTLASPTCAGTNPGIATTKTLCAKPTITSLVNATDPLGNPGFKVTWSAVPGANAYRVYWRNLGNGSGWSFVDTTNGTTKTLTAANNSLIAAGATIAVYVAVNNCTSNPNTIGEGSNFSYLVLTPASSCLATPTFSANSNCPNQISITGLSGSSSGNYQIMLRRVFPTFTSGVTYTISSTNVNFTIGTQFAGSVWEVAARSVCSSSSFSSWSNSVIVNVKPACLAINNPVISNMNCFGGVLSWNADDCNGIGISGYYIYVKKSTQTGYTAYPTNSTNTFKAVNWLQPNTTYNIFVRSVACNGSLSANSNVLTFTTAGPGCRNNEEVELTEEFVMNVNTDQVAVNIYPNPANQLFTVVASGLSENEGRVELVNLLGQVISTNIEPVVNGLLQSTFNLDSNISSGMYLVRISSGSYFTTRQLIIAH